MQGMHSAQFMGLINALRTGDPVVDMVLAFALPLILQQLLVRLPPELQRVWKWMFRPRDPPVVEYKRNIVYRTAETTNGSVVHRSDDNTFNLYLLRAIHLYVHRHCQLRRLDDAHLDLTMLVSDKDNNNGSRSGRITNGNANSPSVADMLRTCSMMEKPLENVWLSVGGNVDIMICDSQVSNRGSKNSGGGGGHNQHHGQDGGGNSNNDNCRRQEIRLRSYTSVDCIHNFVQTAFQWYVDEIRAAENKDRFMLDVLTDVRMRGNNPPQYEAYKLGSDKTFDTLFNHKCHQLLTVVDHFQNKTSKYAIKGYPHKLGILLTGMPGTGKTSLIKALAHYTGRHIVNINLANISTNADLRKIFFNKTYQVSSGNGMSHFMRLDFNQVIFVLEDVDASAPEVVMDRTLYAQAQEAKKEKEQEEAKKAAAAAAAIKSPAAFGSRINLPQGIVQPSSSPLAGMDKLNLSGLLNVLDGVVETPGRMVIMTTNHPDILDDALIRPGRIDKILELGYMDHVDDVVKMVQHYYPDRHLTSDEVRMVEDCLHNNEPKTEITPAQMEQLAMEEDNVSGFLDRLVNFSGRDGDGRNGQDDDDDKQAWLSSSTKKKTLPRGFVIGGSSEPNSTPTSLGGSTDSFDY